MICVSPRSMVLIVCVALIGTIAGPNAESAAESGELQLRLEPVCKVASPGLAAVVNVTLANGTSNKVFDAPDLWGDAFWSTGWQWTWKSEDLTYRITPRDVSYGSIPDPAFIAPIRLRPGEWREWVAVIPVPDAFGGKSTATLVCNSDISRQAKLVAETEFVLGPQIEPADVPGVDPRFVRSAISTGMEGMAWSGCRTPEVKAALRQQAFAGDDVLLLAWFCASFADQGQFDEEAWFRLNVASGDKRAIRDANLFRHLALPRTRTRLSQAQADRINRHIEASYPFSEAMAIAATAAVQK